MRTVDFLTSHPVFTRREFADALKGNHLPPPSTVNSHLDRQLRAGRVGRVKSGVFYVAALGAEASATPVDLLLVASRLAPDAVLAYHTALEAHGYAQSVMERLYFLTRTKARPVRFRGRSFLPVAPPRGLEGKAPADFLTVELERRGLPCRVTSLERTAVDTLDRPNLCAGLEEVWRSLASIPLLHLDEVLEYVRLRGVATLAAKVGLFLERHREQLAVSDAVLKDLGRLVPRQPHYLVRGMRGRLVPRWNLIVPEAVATGEWEAIG